MCVLCMFVPPCTWERQRTTWASWLSLYAMWVLRTSQPGWHALLCTEPNWKFRTCVVCVYVCVWGGKSPVCQILAVEDRGQLGGVDFAFLPCGSQGWTQAVRLGGKCLNCWAISRPSQDFFSMKLCYTEQTHINLSLHSHPWRHLIPFQSGCYKWSRCELLRTTLCTHMHFLLNKLFHRSVDGLSLRWGHSVWGCRTVFQRSPRWGACVQVSIFLYCPQTPSLTPSLMSGDTGHLCLLTF